MYKTESTLGLVGSILSVVLTFFILIFALVCRILLRWATTIAAIPAIVSPVSNAVPKNLNICEPVNV